MIPPILCYKYVKFDEGPLCIIKEGTIKFTDPRDFNDPFDCHPEVDEEALYKSTVEDKPYFERITNTSNLPPGRRIEEKAKQKAKLKNHFHNYNKVMNNNIGICCLSKTPLNLLMWAHYAENHRGFVIEFSIPQTLPLSSTSSDDIYYLDPLPVEYKEKKPIITNRKDFKKYALTKSLDWEYEQEWRVIDFNRKDDGIRPYNRNQILKSVIAGMRISDDNFAVLKNIVDSVNKELGMNVTVHKAEPVSGKFALFVKDRDDLNIQNCKKIAI